MRKMISALRFRAARVLAVAVAGVLLAAPSARGHGVLTYQADVRPIVERSCGGVECHLNQVTSGVDLSSYEAVMSSVGDRYSGLIVVPGDPAASPLFDKISRETPAFGERMPKDGEPLSDADVNTVLRWILDGAINRHLPEKGDANADDMVGLADAVFILNYLFRSGPEPDCVAVADADSSGDLTLTDAVRILTFLFRAGPAMGEVSEEEFEACQSDRELSFASLYEKVLARSCAFSSCHSAAARKGDLSFESMEVAYEDLVGKNPFNKVALASGMMRVDAGRPENSFLVKKLVEPGPGEGNRMPANSPTPLSDATINAFREWIRAGAPLEGTIEGVPDIGEEPPPPIERLPQPPVPENGVQIHLAPFTIGPGAEREIFSFVETPFATADVPGNDVVIERIDIHMMEASHHFIIYEWIGASRPPPGLRPIGSTVDIVTNRRFVVGSQQSFFSFALPGAVGLKFSKDTSFDLNSHYVNLNSEQSLMGEVYVNIFFAAPGTVTTFVQPIFEINPIINVPPSQTRTTRWLFPGPTSQQLDPALGSSGRVRSETHVYSLSTHMHRHGDRFSVFHIRNGADLDPPSMVHDNFSWDDPKYEIYNPPLILRPGEGLRFETTHTYHDPPAANSPPLTFGLTSEDEMAILLGYYAIP